MKTPKIKSKTFPWIRTPEGDFKIILEVRPDLMAKNNVTKEGLLAQICPELFSKPFLVVMFRNLSVSERTLKSLYQEKELVESGWNIEQTGMVEYEITNKGLEFQRVLQGYEDKRGVEWFECSSVRLEKLIKQKVGKFLKGERFKNWYEKNIDCISNCFIWVTIEDMWRARDELDIFLDTVQDKFAKATDTLYSSYFRDPRF